MVRSGAALPVLRDGTTVLVAFTRALAAAGLPADPQRTVGFLAAVDALDVASGRDVYWAGRVTMTANPDHLPVYDAVFSAYFGALTAGNRGRRSEPAVRLVSQFGDAGPTGDGGDGAEPQTFRTRASATEVLRHRDLARLTAAERRELARLLELLRPGLPMRSSRRHRPHRRGPIDPRRTVHAMLAAGGEPGVPARRRRRTRPRRIVLLIDVSGSMSPYADALLRFAHVVHRYSGSANTPVETFTLGTRLTRVTKALGHRDPDRALVAAADTIPDYSGGTRLGEALKAFGDRWGRRGTARGAVVVLFSDGWERGSTDELAEQIRRLSRLTRSLIWVNPHKGKDGYAPVQSGIVAALPYLDHFLAGHSLATLEELLEVIRDA